MSDRKRYYEQATSWALDTQARQSRTLRIAWIVAGVAAGIAMLEAVALLLLTPLKTVEPITLLVDRQTGFVQALDPRTPRRIQADAALTDSLLAQYVGAREGFDRATVSGDYRKVALWSTGLARSQYLATMLASNPNSPLQRYPFGTVVATRVKSVSPLSPGTALVRFDTQLSDRSGRIATAQPWVAIVRYRYSDAPMSFENRLANPLGFQVTSYRRDAEAPAVAAASTTARPEPTQAYPAASRYTRSQAYPAARVYPSAYRATLRPSDIQRLAERGFSAEQIPSGSPLAPPVDLAQR